MIKLTETQEIRRLKRGCIRIENVRRSRPDGFPCGVLGHRLWLPLELQKGERMWQVAPKLTPIVIEPRCLIQEDGRSCLLQDDFAIGENGFVAVSEGS